MPNWIDRLKRFGRRPKRAGDPLSLLASLADSLGDAVIGLTNDGMVVLWNASAQRLSGRDAEDVLGCALTSIVPPELRAEVSGMLEQVIKRHRSAVWVGSLVGELGDRVPVWATVRSVRDEFGTVRGAVLIIRGREAGPEPGGGRDLWVQGALEPMLDRAGGLLPEGSARDHQISDEELFASVEELLRDDPPGRPRRRESPAPSADAEQQFRGLFGPRLGEEPLPKGPGREHPQDLTELFQEWLGFRGFFVN
ncbi:MAG: PAS domain-containing protein [Dehalococcoidia bacterium]